MTLRPYYIAGAVSSACWLNNKGSPHNPFGPAAIWMWPSGKLRAIEYHINGHTHRIDGPAIIHYDEARVGEVLLQLAERGIARDSLFLQTKFTPVNGQDHRTPYDASASITTQVRQSFESSLVHLHTDYLDSYVLHGPYSRRGLGAEDWEVWAAIESQYDARKTKMIGVSNVSADRKSTRLNSSHIPLSRMPSSA